MGQSCGAGPGVTNAPSANALYATVRTPQSARSAIPHNLSSSTASPIGLIGPALGQPPSALRPSLVILMQRTSIGWLLGLTTSFRGAARPARTRPARIRRAVGEHDCFGGTERTASEQLECAALFRAEMTFSRGRRHLDLLALRPIISPALTYS